jgi:hypothetical protein
MALAGGLSRSAGPPSGGAGASGPPISNFKKLSTLKKIIKKHLTSPFFFT